MRISGRFTLSGTLSSKCSNHLTKILLFMNPFGDTITALPETSEAVSITSRFKRFPGTRYSGGDNVTTGADASCNRHMTISLDSFRPNIFTPVYRHNLLCPLALPEPRLIHIKYPLRIHNTPLQKVLRKLPKKRCRSFNTCFCSHAFNALC